MKTTLVKAAIFFKRPLFIYRLIGIFLAFFIVFSYAIPDIQFNLASGKAIEMTLDQLVKTSKADLPRYLKIKDAVVPSDSYIEIADNNSFKEIYYPVYPKNHVNSDFDIAKLDSIKGLPKEDSASFKIVSGPKGLSIIRNTNTLNAKLIIHHTHVPNSELDSTGHYFDSPNFSIEGRYDGTTLPEDIKTLFVENNVKINDDTILLKRGNKAMETSTAIFVILGGLIIALLCILSFVPTGILARWAGMSEIVQPIKP